MSILSQVIAKFAQIYEVDHDELDEACAVYPDTLVPLLMGVAREKVNADAADEIISEYIEAAEQMIDCHRDASSIDKTNYREEIARRVVRYDKARTALREHFVAQLAAEA
jgi:hypothetical protein